MKKNKIENEKIVGKEGNYDVVENTTKIYGGDYPLDPMLEKNGINVTKDNPETKNVFTNKPGINGEKVAPPTTATAKVFFNEKTIGKEENK